jgi:hypothetical protein
VDDKAQASVELLRGFAAWCEDTAIAEARTDKVAEKKLRSAKAKLAEACKLVGLKLTDEQLHYAADLEQAKPDATKPWPNARVVKFWVALGDKNSYAAVRKRPGELGYEAVTGHEVFGSRGSRSQGYHWATLHGTAPTAKEVEEVLKRECGTEVKERRYER